MVAAAGERCTEAAERCGGEWEGDSGVGSRPGETAREEGSEVVAEGKAHCCRRSRSHWVQVGHLEGEA